MLKPIAFSFMVSSFAILEGCAVGGSASLEERPVPMRDGPREHAAEAAGGASRVAEAQAEQSMGSAADAPSDPPPRPRSSGKTVSVVVGSGEFAPRVINVQLGDTVEFVWTNGANSVTSGFGCRADGMFASGTRPTPASYRVTFLRTGVFPFYSEPECETMTGMIAVTAAS